MAKTQQDIEGEIQSELGHRRKSGLLANACSRVCGVLTRNGSDWDKAFEHIRPHFREMPGKPSHTVYRNKRITSISWLP